MDPTLFLDFQLKSFMMRNYYKNGSLLLQIWCMLFLFHLSGLLSSSHTLISIWYRVINISPTSVLNNLDGIILLPGTFLFFDFPYIFGPLLSLVVPSHTSPPLIYSYVYYWYLNQCSDLSQVTTGNIPSAHSKYILFPQSFPYYYF